MILEADTIARMTLYSLVTNMNTEFKCPLELIIYIGYEYIQIPDFVGKDKLFEKIYDLCLANGTQYIPNLSFFEKIYMSFMVKKQIYLRRAMQFSNPGLYESKVANMIDPLEKGILVDIDVKDPFEIPNLSTDTIRLFNNIVGIAWMDVFTTEEIISMFKQSTTVREYFVVYARFYLKHRLSRSISKRFRTFSALFPDVYEELRKDESFKESTDYKTFGIRKRSSRRKRAQSPKRKRSVRKNRRSR